MNIIKLIKFNFITNLKYVLTWTSIVFGIMFLYMILFPSVEDMASIKLESMPKELLQFVGMEELSDMGNFVTYFESIFYLILVAISIFAATFTARIISKEESSKTIEFLYSLKISRLEIYISKVLTGMIATMMLCIAVFVATIICGFAVGGETFVLFDVLQITKFSSLIPFVFFALSAMLAGISGKISAGSLSSMGVMVAYMVGYLGTLLGEKAEWLRYITPFEMLKPQVVLDMESETFVALFVFYLITILLLVVGGIVYKKRDFNI